jgi:hypothetical protein
VTGRSVLLRRAAATAVVAVVANVLLSFALSAAVDAAEDFVPLTAPAIAVATVVGVLLGTAVCVAARRFAPRPRATALSLVAAGTLLSLGGPLSLLVASEQDQPGVTDAAALALLPLHVLVGAAVAIGLAARLPHRR